MKHCINNIDEHLEFKITKEENHITNYLDLTIQRKHNEFELSIYRKPTYIDIAIHFTSNHPHRHKMAGFYFYINRMTNILSSEQAINPYPTAFPYGNGMVLHFYQQQESSTTKTVHKVINKGLKAYV